MKSLSRVQLFATPWTVVFQALPSMGFSRQGFWSGLPFPSPEDLPNPGIEPRSPTLQADALPSEPPGKPSRHNDHLQKFCVCVCVCVYTHIYIHKDAHVVCGVNKKPKAMD